MLLLSQSVSVRCYGFSSCLYFISAVVPFCLPKRDDIRQSEVVTKCLCYSEGNLGQLPLKFERVSTQPDWPVRGRTVYLHTAVPRSSLSSKVAINNKLYVYIYMSIREVYTGETLLSQCKPSDMAAPGGSISKHWRKCKRIDLV